MRKPFYLVLLILLCSHDLYVKMDNYFLKPNQETTLSLYNGTFEKSENIISRDRMLDASIIAKGQRTAIDSTQWKDQDSTITQLTFTTGESGTYVAGVSTKARNIELTAEKFNSYLEHDGVLDMLEERTNDSLLNQDAVESYEKHVKAIYQVGDSTTKDWGAILGYPIEFVPQANPYEKYSGENLEVKLLLDGEPLSNQLVYADYIKTAHEHNHDDDHHHHDGEEHSHDDHAHGEGTHDHSHDSHTDNGHTHTNGQQLRTNDQGVAVVNLSGDGIYYLRTIYMTRAMDNDALTHRSKWATLTFQVSHKHDESSHTHDHDHDHDEGFSTWIFVLGSLLVIVILFLVFRK
ncbi:MAG: DUF4198 domain-containing protein [Bacteroidota bacterium]